MPETQETVADLEISMISLVRELNYKSELLDGAMILYW